MADMPPRQTPDAVQWRLERIIDDGGPLTLSDKAVLRQAIAALDSRASNAAEVERKAIRDEIINTPETADFMAGVPLEAAHQRERWGADHDAALANWHAALTGADNRMRPGINPASLSHGEERSE